MRKSTLLKLKLALEQLSKKRLVLCFQLAEKHCPEMLDETISSAADIENWVKRFKDRLPPEARKELGE